MNSRMIKQAAISTILLIAAMPAEAHVGAGTTASFTAGFMHPLSGLDHMAVMIAVGLWAVGRYITPAKGESLSPI